MGKAAVGIGGVLLAGAAIASLAMATSRSREAGRERDQRLASERQVADLRARVKLLETKAPEPRPAPPPLMGEPPGDSAATAALKTEVETLRSALQAALAKLAEVQRQGPRLPDRGRPRVEDTVTLQARAVDMSKTAAERIEALAQLRMLPGGRNDAVAGSMLDLLESGIEAMARADILRHLKGAVPEAQAPRVVAFLRSDPERNVREEAAETLAPLRALADVRSALEEASRDDASEQVRREARRALERD